jgi:hypothetical protein
MAAFLNSNELRVAGYVAVTVAALVAGWREHRRRDDEPSLWPTFWWLTSAVLFLMAAGRAFGVSGLISDFGRHQALAGGWYDRRRKFQAVVVGGVGAIWLITVIVALWRVPERRRHYLPMALMVFSLMCFAGIRLISLHQIDGLLERRHIAGVKIGALTELIGLTVSIAVTFWQPRTRSLREPARTDARSTTSRW